MKDSVFFYTQVLDFKLVGTWPEEGEPSFSILMREGAELHLSTHSRDGAFGSVACILVDKIDEVFNHYKQRDLNTTGKPGSPVHHTPLDQTWGNREFYVDDPNGNTLRFIKRQ